MVGDKDNISFKTQRVNQKNSLIGKISVRKSSVKLKKINKTKGHGNRHLNAYYTGGRRSARMVDYNADAVKICPT